MAAGISTVSHRAPPNIAAMPSMTNIAVAPVDFFKSALIKAPKQSMNRIISRWSWVGRFRFQP
jgi:hypothetical protein